MAAFRSHPAHEADPPADAPPRAARSRVADAGEPYRRGPVVKRSAPRAGAASRGGRAGAGADDADPAQAVPPAPDLSTPAAAAAALRTFFRIARSWKLDNEQQQVLLGCRRTTFFDWKAGRVKTGLDRGTLERLSHVFGIYAALHLLLPVPERADAWVHRANAAPLFGGGTALERMLAGQVADLYVVRQYLDAQRGGWA